MSTWFSQFRDLGVEHEFHLLKPGFFKDIKVDLSKLSCDILGELSWTGRQGFSCICLCSEARNPQNHRACRRVKVLIHNFLQVSKWSFLLCFSRWWFPTFFMFIPILTHIFQLGWNHQLDPTGSYCHFSNLEQREVDITPCYTAEI